MIEKPKIIFHDIQKKEKSKKNIKNA